MKNISFVPGRSTASTSRKAFDGFNNGEYLSNIILEDRKYERIRSYVDSSMEKGVITEKGFYQKFYQEGHTFSYIESMENPMRVLKNDTTFNWIENLEENCGIPDRHQGISTPWLYIGETGSMFPFHVEDGNLLSMNFHITGAPKLWYGVQPRDIERVEEILQEHPTAQKCRSFFRHKHHFIDPAYLQSRGVPVYSVLQEPGDIIIPLSFHQGLNLGMNVLVAINKYSGTCDLLKHRVASHCRAKPYCQYPTKSNYIQNVFLHLYKDEIKCEHCPAKTFSTKKGFNYHMQTKHNSLLENGNGNAKCPICDLTFAQLDNHLKNKHNEEMPKLFCCLCRVSYGKLKLLEKHWNEAHRIERKCYSCTGCPKKSGPMFK